MSNSNYETLRRRHKRIPGATMGPDPLPVLTKIARKAKRVGDCIEGGGARDEDGYAYIWHDRRKQRAHRAVWERVNGPIPKGMNVLHHCDNAPCVNPAHLYVGTQQQNMEDRVRRGRWKGGAPLGNRNGVKKK